MHMYLLVRDNTWAGPWAGPSNHGPARQTHGPAHAIVWPAHIEPVSHGLRCHVMGRAGSRIFENVMGWAGPRPVL